MNNWSQLTKISLNYLISLSRNSGPLIILWVPVVAGNAKSQNHRICSLLDCFAKLASCAVQLLSLWWSLKDRHFFLARQHDLLYLLRLYIQSSLNHMLADLALWSPYYYVSRVSYLLDLWVSLLIHLFVNIFIICFRPYKVLKYVINL